MKRSWRTFFRRGAGSGTGRRAALAMLGTAVVVLSLGSAPVAQASVAWTGMPRAVYTPKQGQQLYAYAPAVVSSGGKDYYYSCRNDQPGQIRSRIWLTRVGGELIESDASALAPTGSGWDGFHVCDPSVVAGTFRYGGETYSHAMFYSGTDLDAASHFQIGVAFARSLDGPWTRYPTPIVAFDGASTAEWGVGQPSATTVDANAGRVLLFYTRSTSSGGPSAGSTSLLRRDITLGDMNAPSISAAQPVTTSGLTQTDGTSDPLLENVDVAYDGTRDRFYAVRQAHPYPAGAPQDVAASLQIASIPSADVWNGGGTWSVEGDITAARTGLPRNHNGALVRTPHGGLPSGTGLGVVFTRSLTGAFPAPLWTYDLWRLDGSLPGAPSSGPVTWTSPRAKRVYTPTNGAYYAYAPSLVTEGGRTYMYTCHNTASGQIKDAVYFTEFNAEGHVVADKPVLEPSPGRWDSVHVCDTSLVKGAFRYDGHTYPYAIVYLGTDTNCSCHNQIGVAFADAPEGPWIKHPDPIIGFGMSDNRQWGVGQATATVVDANAGRLLIMYTSDANYDNGTYRYGPEDFSRMHAYRRDVTLGDMSNPVVGPAVEITKAGLAGLDGSPDVLNGFDVAYDPSRDRFYAVGEMHPYPTAEPFNIGAATRVVSIDSASIWNGGGTWREEGAISSANTGFARNHNAGILRTVSGTLPDPNELTVWFTGGVEGPGFTSLWSYDVWEMRGPLSP